MAWIADDAQEELVLGGIIFDMDGVLIDSHPVHKFAWRELFGLVGKSFTDEEMEFVLDGAKREEIMAHFLGPLKPKQASVYGRIKEEFYLDKIDQIKATTGVRDFMMGLREAGITMAVATSATRTRTLKTLDSLGMINDFAAVVTGDEVQKGKPHPALFQKAARLLGLPTDSVIVIEDAVSGVRAASAAKMKSVGIGCGSRQQPLLDAGASFVFPDFRDLKLPVLQQLTLTGSDSSPSSRDRHADVP